MSKAWNIYLHIIFCKLSTSLNLFFWTALQSSSITMMTAVWQFCLVCKVRSIEQLHPKEKHTFYFYCLSSNKLFFSKWTWRKEQKNNSEYDNQVQIVFVYLIILQYHWHGGFFNFFSFLGIYSWKLNNSSYTDKTDTKSKVIWI